MEASSYTGLAGKFNTLYVGGGTPSLLSTGQLKKLFSIIASLTGPLPRLKESTFEANPESLDEEKAALIKKAGINRVSMGLQASQDSLLKRLGRVALSGDFLKAFGLLRAAGFDNINADLMCGLPGQTDKDFAGSIEWLLKLKPEHVSFYALEVHDGTPFSADGVKEEPEAAADMYEAGAAALKLADGEYEKIWAALGGGDADLALLLIDKKAVALKVLGEIRRTWPTDEAAKKKMLKFAWVTDFPLFEWSEEEKRHVSMHHPFTSPVEEDAPYLESDPARVRAKAYDLILNGVEVGGGSIRIHDMDLQRRIFKSLGLTDKETEEKFGYFLEALSFGAPPHGGIAFGFDRLVMILAGEESIREVIPFPKTTSALDLMTNSPSEVNERQLIELGLKLR